MRINRRAIRFKLTLWYIGILALILAGFGGVLYANVARSLYRNIDKGLQLQAASVADTITLFWKAEQAATGNWSGSPGGSLEQEIEQGRFPAIVSRWSRQATALDGRPVRVISRDGQVLAVSNAFRQLPVPSEPGRLQITPGKTTYQTVNTDTSRYRVATAAVERGGRVYYGVQVAASMDQADDSLRRLGRWLLWMIPLTLLLTSAGGYFLASTALKPIGSMIGQAQRIGAEALQSRIDVPHSGDELEQLAVTFNDMLARLERAFRRLRRFSAAASHELRTPLTVMKGELEVALRKPRDAEEYQRVLRAHLQAVDEMTRTVEELLTLARSEAVEGAVEWHPVELNTLAQQVGSTWMPIAKAKSVRLEIPVQEPVWVRGERRLLERLLGNLLDNAIRHTPPNGLVSVKTDSTERKACISVRDSGRGIPKEDIPKIFDKFFQKQANAELSHSTSTGIGLGLCRWIVEAHHGQLEVDSSPGIGSTFTVWLPLLPSTN